MEIKKTNIPGCFELFPKVFCDDRGKLIKTFHLDTFKKLGLTIDFAEEYYSVSVKGVLRGLHLQIPPYEHVKCVTCLQGKIFDVVVDLRSKSPTYRQYFFTELDSDSGKMLYIPAGCAHGFYTLSENAIFLNRTTTVFNPNADTGIRWDSCGVTWPDHNPILSEKDKNLPALHDFKDYF
jgi:dTDP-4-dehydrorhamnose 3,5-epimerase